MQNDMHSNLWDIDCAEVAPTAPLEHDLDVDLAVIGGGFTGCAAALEAACVGASVALLEAREFGHGGSGRNVGLVNAGLWLPPDGIIARLGKTAGVRLISILSEAPARVFSLIETHAIACDPTRAGTLHCAHASGAVHELEARCQQLRRHGAPVALLDRGEVRRRTGAEGLHGALFDPRAGTIQPLAYCRGLARAAVGKGARLFARTPVRRIARARDRWILRAGSHEVRAKALLMATNAYHKGLADAPFAPHFVPVFYSQFATNPLPAATLDEILRGGEGCWDTAPVMSSFRLDRAGRLLLGGIGNLQASGAAVHEAWALRKLRTLFPKLAGLRFHHAWSGRIAMTGDHIPKIVVFGPDAFACFGYSGRGIAPGTVFGTAAARALLSGDQEMLPLAPIMRHAERFTRARAVYYELGATLVHAARPAPFSQRAS